MGKGSRQNGAKLVTYIIGMTQVVMPPMAYAQSGNAQIVPDGQTQTSLSIQGNITDVRTQTISGTAGLNSFSVFDVYEGNEVNLHLPDNTNALINFVHDKQSNIDGILTAYQNGLVGGNVYFLNPYGIYIGESGVINAGAVHLQTPTHDFMNNLFRPSGVIEPHFVGQVLSNDVPLSQTGVISVAGQVNALEAASVQAGRLNVSGAIETGEPARIKIENIVNSAGAFVDLDATPDVMLAAEADIVLTGRVAADGGASQSAGVINVTAGEDITLGNGAHVSASASGTNGDGGWVRLFAEDTALLEEGAAITANAGASGDGGFVEFSARQTVELAGGTLQATAENGQAGTVLIDPENLTISANLMRDDGVANGGVNSSGTSWSAGNLILQADNQLTVNNNIIISSRDVADPTNAASHESGNSIGDSGNITLEADQITLNTGAKILAHTQGGSSYAAGDITLSAQAENNAAITINDATIQSGNLTLSANATSSPLSVYANPLSTATSAIALTSGSITTSGDVTIRSVALQNKAATQGALVSFDARSATATINLEDLNITSAGGINLTSDADIYTDLTPTGWASFSTALPANIQAAVTQSTARTIIGGNSIMIAQGGNIEATTTADTLSTLYAEANFQNLALTGAVNVLDTTAETLIEDTSVLFSTNNISINSQTNVQANALADASSGDASLSGALGFAVSLLDVTTNTKLLDTARVVTTGDVNFFAESVVQNLAASRAASDATTEAIDTALSDALDDTTGMNQIRDGETIGSIISAAFDSGLGSATSQISDGADTGSDGGNLQIAGAVTYSSVTNNTHAYIGPRAATGNAPELSAQDLVHRARGVVQSQAIASGQAEDFANGGSAGIAIQETNNQVRANIAGNNDDTVLLSLTNLTIQALSESHRANIGDYNSYGVTALSGAPTAADDGIGIAGAIAVSVNETNQIEAALGDDVSLNNNGGDIVIAADGDTRAKTKADGSGDSHAAVDAVFDVLDETTDTDSGSNDGGTVGIGASIAVTISDNDVTASIGGDNSVNAENASVTATQNALSQTQAKAGGAGGVAVIPVAAVTVARNQTHANVQGAFNTMAVTGDLTVRADQTAKATALGEGVATLSGEDANAAIGLTAGLVISDNQVEATLNRDIAAGDDVTVQALSTSDIETGGKAGANLAKDDDTENDDEETGGNNLADSTNAMVGLGNAFSDEDISSSAITDKLSVDSDALGGTEDSDENKSLTVAAAFAVNYVEDLVSAKIGNEKSITGDSVLVESLRNIDVRSDADASADSGAYNLGGAVGLNIADMQNLAELGTNVLVDGREVTVRAGMRSLTDGNITDSQNAIQADATAGVGTGEFSLAGAVGLNVILRNQTSAALVASATVVADELILVDTLSTNDYTVKGKATVGDTARVFSGIEGYLSSLDNFTALVGGVSTALGVGTADDSPAPASDDDDEAGEGNVGIGAGFGVNVVLNDTTTSRIADNATITAHTAPTTNISVTASGQSNVTTSAEAGAKPDEASGSTAKTSLDAAVAVAVVTKSVTAEIGTGNNLDQLNNLIIQATGGGHARSHAFGEVEAEESAVGASVAVAVIDENVSAGLNRSVLNSAGITVTARTSSTDIALADAVAAGTVVRKYADKLNLDSDNLLGSDALARDSDAEDNPASMKALGGGFSGGDGAGFDLTGDNTDAGSGGSDNQQSGSINIAASVAVNWTDHDSTARIGDGVSLTSSGNVSVLSDNDVNYRTRGSGMAVFADNAIGVGVGILKTGQDTQALIGDNVTITAAQNVSVRALTSENQGTDPVGNASFGSYASAEGVAGAGGGDLGVAGALGLVYSGDSQFAGIGIGADITHSGNLIVQSQATNKIVNRAWALAVASDATCSDPGNCNSDSNKTAVGASIAVNVITDTNYVELAEDGSFTTGGTATVEAEDLSPENAAFDLDPEGDGTTTEEYLTTNYTTILQNASYYAEAIAGGAAQGGNAGSGSLAVTVSLGSTKALIGEGVTLSADALTLRAYNESDARHLVGALAIAEKKAIGGSLSGIYLREDVSALVGTDGDADSGATTRLETSAGDLLIQAEADQENITLMAAGGVSTNELALSGALGVNVMDTDIEARVTEDAVINAHDGDVRLEGDSNTRIKNFALAVSGSGGSDSAGGSLALNLFLTDKKAELGQSANADNNIATYASDALRVDVDATQDIINGVISAGVSTSGNAISGALSSNIIKGDTVAALYQGVTGEVIAPHSSVFDTGVFVTADDTSNITDLTGTLAASSSTSVGVALGANVFWKNVNAVFDGTISPAGQVDVTAETEQNLTATVVGIAGSSGGFSGAGSVSAGVVKSTTEAKIGSNANIDADGSVKLHAGDNTDIFMLEPAASFSSGGTALAGAVGAAVFVGTTKARIYDGAVVDAQGQTAMQVALDSVTTSSPLLDGIFSGDDEQTRSALSSFNDSFTFDNVKDLFLTETRNTETRYGVSVSAVSDQDVISIAASGAVSSDSAIAISLSAGVGVSTTEASIGAATVRTTGGGNNADVMARAISDTYWVDLSAALGAGTGSAGVGVGGDVVVQVKNTYAFIENGADIDADGDVVVNADNKDRVVNSAATLGIGSTAGVAGTAAVGVMVNDTKAWIDGNAAAQNDLTVRADADSDLIQIAGGIGGGSTAGIGASFGVAYVKNTTEAYIDDDAVTNASGDTLVTANTGENSVAAVIAGGIGGTVGVAVSAGIKIHESNTRAYIKGSVNQDAGFAQAGQNVDVEALNRVTTIDVVGGIAGGGTVGVGVSLNALVVHNNAQAYIGGGTNTRVSAFDNIDVTADSDKNTKNFTLAGAAAGTVSVAGNVAVILVGATNDDESNDYMNDGEDGNYITHTNERINAIDLSAILSDDASDGDYARTGDAVTEIGTVYNTNKANADIAGSFTPSDSNLSRNKTQAFVENGATVTAGGNLTLRSDDTITTIFTAGAVGGAGVVGVGATVGTLVFNTSSESYIDSNASVNVSEDTLIHASTAESVGSGALSAGGAGITSVQGVVMTQATYSRTRAFIEDNALLNQTDNSNDTQSVSVLATSDTDLVTFSGSGGGALVGVGITGDVMILEKETRAWIGENAQVASGGDVSVDARSQEDLLQIAMSINGGLVGVTGAAGVVVVSNLTEAEIEAGAIVTADDSIRVQATDDSEIDAIIITGAGGAVGVGGSVGTYVLENITRAQIEQNAQVTALAEAAGDGIAALTGAITSTDQTSTQAVRQQDGSLQDQTITTSDTNFVSGNASGLIVAAVTQEDVDLAPVGLAIGAVGVVGTIATTVTDSTTEALIGQGATINSDNTGAGNFQSLALLAKSDTRLNNVSAGLAYGGVGVANDLDTQVYEKTVRARMLGTAQVERDVDVTAFNRDRVTQTMVSSAIGASDGIGGLVGVSVVADEVVAEIGDGASVTAKRDITVDSDQDISIVQTGGNVSGGGGTGVGASLGVLVAKSSNTARIGDNATITAYRDLDVLANTLTNINQNVIGFGGGGTAAIVGSVGINMLKTTTLAEIGASTNVNATANPDYDATQSVTLAATDSVTTQGAAGAGAIGGAAGVGVGITVTVTRNSTVARVGDNSVIKAQDDISIAADATKNISNQGIAAAGGIGLGAAGSVALTLIGGSMSEDGSDALTNDNGSIIGEADQSITSDRNANASDGGQQNTNTSRLDDYDTNSKVATQTANLRSDIEGDGADSTLTQIGNSVQLVAGDDIGLAAEETISLSQIAGGAAGGAVGVGGFVAVGDYNGSVRTSVGNNSALTLGGDLTLTGVLNSGADKNITVPLADDITVKAVNSTVIGASIGLLGANVTVSQLNLNENVTAAIGDNVSVASTSSDMDSDVTIQATRDVDAETNVLGLAAGAVAAGVSVAGVNASGDAVASIGNNTSLGSNATRLGAVTLQALNESTQNVRAGAGGIGYLGAGVGAGATVSDSGTTRASIGTGSAVYGGGLVTVSSLDRARNYGNAVGVAVSAGFSMSGIISRVSADRDAYTLIGDNATLVGNGLQLSSTIGESGQNMADSDVVGATGGIVAGSGSESTVSADADTKVQLGNNVSLKSNALLAGEETAGGTLNINATNLARIDNDSRAVAAGVAALGVHLTHSTSSGDSRIVFGTNTDLMSMDDITIASLSDRDSRAQAIAGAGGLVAANGAESTVTHQSNVGVIAADGTSTGNGLGISAAGSLVVTAINNDSYDASMDAGAVALGGVTGAVARMTGSATTSIDFGDYADMTSHGLVVTADNNLTKSGLDDNFKFDGGGAISITIGDSRTRHAQNALVDFGNYSNAIITGSKTDNQDAVITSRVNIVADDEAIINTGALVGVPISDTQIIANSTARINMGENSGLYTQRGDVTLLADTLSSIDADARTSVWGLAGVGATGLSDISMTGRNTIDIGTGTQLLANGYLTANAGREASLNRITAQTNIYNNTLIAGIFGEKSDARLSLNSDVNIAESAALRSAQNLIVEASTGSRSANAVGYKEWLQYIGIAVVPINSSFGNAQLAGNSNINVSGTLETGVYSEQYIGFGTNFGTFREDPNNPGTVEKMSVTQADGVWTRSDGTQMDVPVVDSYSDDKTTTMRSNDFVRWRFDPNRDLSQDIDTEINQLEVAKLRSFNSDAADALADKQTTLLAEQAFYQGLQSGQMTAADVLATLQDQLAAKQTEYNNADPADQPDIQTEIDDIQNQIDNFSLTDADVADNVDYTDVLANIATELTSIQAQIDSFDSSGDPATVTKINNEIAFLEAKKANLNQGPVDVIVVEDIFAATGHIYAKADNLTGTNTGALISNHEVSVTIRNDSNSPIEIGDIDVPRSPGGSIYFNEVLVQTQQDIANLNRNNSAQTDFGLTSSPGNFNTSVQIDGRYNPNSSAYNPDVSVPIKAPSMILSGTIMNRAGSVNVVNKNGSIYSDGQIQARRIKVTSGGAFFVNDKTPGIYNVGAAPTADTRSNNSDPQGYGDVAAARIDNIGQPDADLGGCTGSPSYAMPHDNGGVNNNTESCHVGTVNQSDDESARLFGDEVYIVANTINVNGLIQSGVANKSITINENYDAFTNNDGVSAYTLEDVAIDLNGQTGANREGIGGVTAEYIAAEDVIEISGLEAKGGKVTLVGKLISTGNGEIKVLDGYGTFNVNNLSDKDVRINYANLGEVEGVVTLIDDAFADSNGVPRVTQYTRIGDTLTVRNNVGTNSSNPTELVSTVAGRDAQYAIKDGMRYYWIEGESLDITRIYRTDRRKKVLIGINIGEETNFRPPDSSFTSQEIPADMLPSADYAAIDTSVTDDYRFRMRYDETYYDINTVRDPDPPSCFRVGASWAPLYEDCSWTNVSTEISRGSLFYYQDVSADRPIGIEFIGSDTGTFNVTSGGGIQIGGEIKAVNTVTTLTANNGDITAINNSAVIEVDDVTLSATGSIGNGTNAIKLVQDATDTITANAGNGVYIKSENGDLRFASLVNSAGDIELVASENIYLTTTDNVLTGENISLRANYGELADLSGNAIKVNTGSGALSAYSRSGDIAIVETQGDLRLRQIDAFGNVSISVPTGSLLDGNQEQTDDVATQEALLSLWADLRLTGDDAVAKRNEQMDSYRRSMNQLYGDYWSLRNLAQNADGSYSADAYDANFNYTVTAEERAEIASGSFVAQSNALYQDYWQLRDVQQNADGDYIAQAYNPNFIYVPTAAEEAALNNDPDLIAQLKLDKQARYQLGYERFGTLDYNPSFDFTDTAVAQYEASREARYQQAYEKFGDEAYQQGFSYSAGATETNALTAGFAWDQEHLEAPLPGQAFKDITDTSAFIETSNIIGDDITLTVATGNIGAFTDTTQFEIADVYAKNLSDEQKILLAAAEADDVDYNQTTGLVTLTQRDDLDIQTRNADSAVIVNTPQGYAFLGGETSVNISSFNVSGDLRLKVSGNIYNIADEGVIALNSENLVLEAATGSIGAGDKSLLINIDDNFSLTARAQTGLWIEEASGDVRVGQLYSPNEINLVSPGAIFDANADLITDIKANDVTLVAANSIGEVASIGDSDTQIGQKALDLATTSLTESRFTLTSQNAGAAIYNSFGTQLRLTQLSTQNNIALMAIGDVRIGGEVNTNGHDFGMIGFSDIIFDDEDNAIFRNTAVNLNATSNMQIDTRLDTQGSNLTIDAVGTFTQSASGEILTGGGVLNVSNGGGTTLNGSVQTAGGDISAAITNNMIIGG
ncbi:MAG: leukotoxin LktA family filamentous adhesin, partial [Parvibaculales bacterium]